jgi:hypothetical protein
MDGGRTVVSSDPKLNRLMEKAAKGINLLPHRIGFTSTVLSAPGDIEGELLCGEEFV